MLAVYRNTHTHTHTHTPLSRGLNEMNWEIEKKNDIETVFSVFPFLFQKYTTFIVVCFMVKFYARLNLGSLIATAHIVYLWELGVLVFFCFAAIVRSMYQQAFVDVYISVDPVDSVNERAPSTFSFSHFMTMLHECVWFSSFFCVCVCVCSETVCIISYMGCCRGTHFNLIDSGSFMCVRACACVCALR